MAKCNQLTHLPFKGLMREIVRYVKNIQWALRQTTSAVLHLALTRGSPPVSHYVPPTLCGLTPDAIHVEDGHSVIPQLYGWVGEKWADRMPEKTPVRLRTKLALQRILWAQRRECVV